MKPRKHPGTCLVCRDTFGKKGAERHLEDCLASTGWPQGSWPSFLLKIDGRHASSFWMFVLARHDAMFCDLDALLTDVWMGEEDDCSSFTIQGTRYIDVETNKCVPLADRITEGQIFSYLYDAHSPEEVEIKLKVVGMTPVMPPEGPCCLVARNTPGLPECSVCGDKAEFLAVDPDVFDPCDEMDGGRYYCRDCLMDFDSAIISPVVNSPRACATFNLDDLEGALAWYPPGWEMDDLVSDDMQEILGMAMEVPDERVDLSDLFGDDDPVVMMEQMAREDIGDEIDGFLLEEEEFGKDVNLSKEIVSSFCTIMYRINEVGIDDWDAALLEQTLIENVVRNPHATPEWAEQFVPVLCRFLEYAESAGRDVDTGELFPALLEAEPEFLRRIAASRHWRISKDGMVDAGLSGVNFGGRDDFVERLLSSMANLMKETEDTEGSASVPKTLLDLLNKKPDDRSQMIAHRVFIAERCGEFCRTRMDDMDIDARCREIVPVIAAHPDNLLLQGFMEEWSGAIVSVACEEAGRIDTVEDMSRMVEEICDFFCLTPSSLQSRVVEVKSYLADSAVQD